MEFFVFCLVIFFAGCTLVAIPVAIKVFMVSDGEDCFENLFISIFIASLFAGISGGIWEENLKEINQKEYASIHKLIKDNPKVKWMVNQAMKDGKINYLEYRRILKEISAVSNKDSKDNLKADLNKLDIN